MASIESPSHISPKTDLDDLDIILVNVSSPTDPSLKGYDLIHQSIISRNEITLSYLFERSYVPPEYHPTCNDYLHLACKLEQVSMVRKIMQARPNDFFRKGRACYPNSCFHMMDEAKLNASAIMGQLPVDTVASSKNVECLATLLRYLPFNERNKLCPLAFICDLNHAAALHLYLKSAVCREDMQAAYKRAINKKRHECLDILLSNGFEDFLCVSGLNPFHVLYQYSSGYNNHVSRHDSLALTTQVLLKHDTRELVSQSTPIGSYPLYTILHLIMNDVEAFGEEYVSRSISDNELLACLRLILKQGVSISFNEVRGANCELPVAAGRNFYRSAFDVVTYHVSSFTTINLASSEVVRECVTLLLSSREEHHLRSEHLSGILLLMGKTKRSSSIQKNLAAVVCQYLWHGIDPSVPNQHNNHPTSSRYPVNQYTESLLLASSYPGAPPAETLSGNLVIKWITNSMDYTSICAANKIFLVMGGAGFYDNHWFTPNLITYLTHSPLLRLKTLAARVIWFSSGRRKKILEQLPLPSHMKSNFLDIIIKEI